jgi:hypothetical protein
MFHVKHTSARWPLLFHVEHQSSNVGSYRLPVTGSEPAHKLGPDGTP